MTANLNLEPERRILVSPSPDTFLDPEALETCAGCGAVHPIQDLSLFFCCGEYFCEQCSCACSIYQVPSSDPDAARY